MTGESLFFVQENAKARPTAKLLFPAAAIEKLTSADGRQVFEPGKDFELSADKRSITLLPGSRIPFRQLAELYPPKGSPNSIGSKAGDPERNLLFGEGHAFHDEQAAVTYDRDPGKWEGYTPEFADAQLPSTIARLRAKKPLVVGVSGDSISQGYNASGYTQAPPLQPAYSQLVTDELQRLYGGEVTLKNRAVAGWSVSQGLSDLDKLLAEKPDLIVIAYGMNDAGGRNVEAYKNGIATMLKRIHNANDDTEVILVASMLGNPEWSATPSDIFPQLRDALASLVKPGVALADMTSLWQELLKHKHYLDLTGNGVNHPNDFGHRLYAQVMLGLLADPELPKK